MNQIANSLANLVSLKHLNFYNNYLFGLDFWKKFKLELKNCMKLENLNVKNWNLNDKWAILILDSLLLLTNLKKLNFYWNNLGI